MESSVRKMHTTHTHTGRLHYPLTLQTHTPCYCCYKASMPPQGVSLLCRTRRMLGIPAQLHHRRARLARTRRSSKGTRRPLTTHYLVRAQCTSTLGYIYIYTLNRHTRTHCIPTRNSRQNPYNSPPVRTSYRSPPLPRTHSPPPRAAGDALPLGLYLLGGKGRKLALWCALAVVPSRPPRGCVALFRLSSTYRFTADACLLRRAANSSTRNACVTP